MVRHITSIIIRVRSVEAVVTTIDGILRHVPLFIACLVEKEELVRSLVDDIPGSGRKEGSS